MNKTYALKRKHQAREGQHLKSARHVSLDAAIGNVNLYFCFNGTAIVGRPIVYLVIDPFSRLILGHSVRFERKSWGSDRYL